MADPDLLERGLPEAFPQLESPWRELAEANGNVFATWEWCATWWRHFGDGREPLLELVRDGDRPAAILPLYRTRRPVRALRLVGDGVADQLGPVCAPTDRELTARRLRELLGEIGHDVLVAERLAEPEGWPELLGKPVWLRESSPTVRLETNDWDAFLGERSGNFRRQAGKFERRLLRDHGLTYRLTREPAELERDMGTLFELHELRWGPGGTGFVAPRARAFHLDFARVALERGWLRLWIAELDGRPAAAWYGFRFGGADWFYQQGRDPALEKTSVGFVLTLHGLREAVTDGMREYKFLLGDEGYKGRFTTEDTGLVTIRSPTTAAGRLGIFAVRAGGRLRPGSRERIEERLLR